MLPAVLLFVWRFRWYTLSCPSRRRSGCYRVHRLLFYAFRHRNCRRFVPAALPFGRGASTFVLFIRNLEEKVMSLKARISEDMKSAMKAKETGRLGAIRLLLAAIKQKEVDERVELDDTGIVAVIDKMQKQRRDSVAQYEAAQRQDLADKERFEMDVLAAYLPQPLSEAEIAAMIDEAVQVSGAAGVADMGKVMGIVKPKMAGRADMAKVSAAIKARLVG